MTVAELQQRMSAQELTEWMEYYRLEPWGEERADLRAGTIAAPLLECWTGKRHNPSKWVMQFAPKRPQSIEEMRTILKALAGVK